VPAISHGMDLLRSQMMHILGATTGFLDLIGNRRAIRPQIMGAGGECDAEKTDDNEGTHQSLHEAVPMRVNATPLRAAERQRG
jgi:hypothetical protein